MSTPSAGSAESAILERRERIVARIAELTDRPVRLVCVTKGHPVEVAAAAVAAGCGDLGESYAQELVPKADVLGSSRRGDGPRWHFVGRLQRNKVRAIAGLVELYHSVDRSSLAREIARRDEGASILVQVDLAGLPERGGVGFDEAPALVAECRSFGLDVRGLMGVGLPGPAEASRDAFRSLAAMVRDLDLVECSMGMSGDVEVAVTEGATMVRIGSSLVGPRPDR